MEKNLFKCNFKNCIHYSSGVCFNKKYYNKCEYIKMLDRQTPMEVRKIEIDKYHTNVHCPVCGRKLYVWASKYLCNKYCPDCGQALDWTRVD